MSSASKCDICGMFGENDEVAYISVGNDYFNICHKCCKTIDFPPSHGFNGKKEPIIKVFRQLTEILINMDKK